MSDKPKRPAFEILRDALLKVKFRHLMIDKDLEMIPLAHRWFRQLNFQYHYAQFAEKPHFWSKWYFRWIYRTHSADFPSPILVRELLPENQVQAVPGGYIESNGFLGYFKSIQDPKGHFFVAPNGDGIEPFLEDLKALRESIRCLIDQSSGDKEKQQLLILHYKDISLNTELSEFIPKVRNYAVRQGVAGLKTGHLFLWISGMNLYFEDLQNELLEMGFAAYQADHQQPLFKLLFELRRKLRSALLNMLLDLFFPLLESVRVECRVEKDKLRFRRVQVIKRSWLSAFVDWFLSFFKKETQEEVPLSQTMQKEKPHQERVEVRTFSKPKPRIKEIRPFKDLYSALEKFLDEMVGSLAPEQDENGTIIDYKAMFDQFDLPEEERDLSYTRFILAGRITGADPMDFRYKDQTIINSTHWLYDRIKKLLERFNFSDDELYREDAFHFLEEVRLLFYPSRRESSEKRKYGTFAQFRINLRRLFVSNKVHSHFHALINQISTFLDKAREQYEKEVKQ